ncbi:MAG: MFS transporter [Bacteroidales bacterium]|nr:MFS transporter [Bacteroidales bacterium]
MTQTTSTETGRRDPGLKRLLAIVAIAIGYILNPLNGSLAVTAYPQLSAYFDVPYAHMSAMVMYFMAATAVGQPLAGGLGDFLGRKNIFLTGILGFTVASAMAASADTFASLLLWRITQAAFSGVIMANGMAMVAQVAPREKIGAYVGFLNSAFVASTVLGFTLGGMLLQFFDWRILFQLNVPLGIAAFVLAVLFIPRDTGRKVHFTVLSFMGVPFLPLAMGLQALVQGEPFAHYFVAFAVALGIIALSIFRSANSRTQLKTFANAPFNLGCLILLFSIALHFAVMFTLPAWSYAALGIESAVMGLYFSLIAGAQVLASPVIGRMIDTRGDRLARAFAVFAIALPVVIMVFWLNRISFALALVLLGCGMAAAQLIAQRTSLLSSSEDSRALAMGIFSSYRSIGGLSGNALAALVLGGYAVITPEAGVEVLAWGFGLFVVPVTLALWALRSGSKPSS